MLYHMQQLCDVSAECGEGDDPEDASSNISDLSFNKQYQNDLVNVHKGNSSDINEHKESSSDNDGGGGDI